MQASHGSPSCSLICTSISYRPSIAPVIDLPLASPTTAAIVEHFLRCSGKHPHPDPNCSSAPSPQNATPSRSTTQPQAVQRQSRQPFMNTTPWILLPTIHFNFY